MSNDQPRHAATIPPILCSVNQAAAALALSPFEALELCRAGQIEAVKRHGRWLVSVADVSRYATDVLAGAAS